VSCCACAARQRLGRKAEAVEAFERANEKDPMNVQVTMSYISVHGSTCPFREADITVATPLAQLIIL
jgi:hypothetical protein